MGAYILLKRKSISKKIREQVYDKYNGHCAYCGKLLEYKDMQVDHVSPVYLNGEDNINNYMPACRACNFYKSTMGIEDFREQLSLIKTRLKKEFIYRLALQYELIEEINKDINFYFERSST